MVQSQQMLVNHFLEILLLFGRFLGNGGNGGRVFIAGKLIVPGGSTGKSFFRGHVQEKTADSKAQRFLPISFVAPRSVV